MMNTMKTADPKSARILIVEDEEDILELLEFNLARAGYQVEGVDSGEKALSAIKEQQPDLILLDLMLPGVDGLEVCRAVKRDPDLRDISVIMVTARGEESDIVKGLEMGADDYITKPFSPKVVAARVAAVLRRRAQGEIPEDEITRIHDIVIHPGRHEVTVGETPVKLTLTEFRVLLFLAKRPGWVFTRNQIVQAVHGSDYPVTERSVDVQIVGLRKKLGSAGDTIETVRGIGYRFKE